jgi:hypothetical protein
MRHYLVIIVCIAGVCLSAWRSFAQDVPAVAAKAAVPEVTPEQEMSNLERERSELVGKIRLASAQAAKDRANAVQANPQMAALRQRISELELQLKETRDQLLAKMKEAGMNVEGAPQAALDAMTRMRQIDVRMRELMQQAAEPKPEIKQEAASPVPVAPVPADGGKAVEN